MRHEFTDQANLAPHGPLPGEDLLTKLVYSVIQLYVLLGYLVSLAQRKPMLGARKRAGTALHSNAAFSISGTSKAPPWMVYQGSSAAGGGDRSLAKDCNAPALGVIGSSTNSQALPAICSTP